MIDEPENWLSLPAAAKYLGLPLAAMKMLLGDLIELGCKVRRERTAAGNRTVRLEKTSLTETYARIWEAQFV